MTKQAEQIALRARQVGDRVTLFWSERGEVACATHAPYAGSDTWQWEKWWLMSQEEQREFTRLLGHSPKCEVCQ